jgi:opacity protein-like surface antigen
MKKHLLFILASFFTFSAIGQVVELTPSYGYQFGAKLGYGPNYLKIKSSDQFGITLGVETYTGLMAEFSYFNMSSELRIRDVIYAPFESKLSDLNVDWFLLGATRYFKEGKVKPFAGGGLGLVVVSPKNENRDIINRSLNSTTKFAFNFKAGVNIMFSEVVGLNLQGNLFFPVNWAGVYIGPGGAGISTGSTVILGSISGGLVFRLDKD